MIRNSGQPLIVAYFVMTRVVICFCSGSIGVATENKKKTVITIKYAEVVP